MSFPFIGFLKLQIVSEVKNKCPQTPLVLYINGNGGLLERLKGTGVDVIGLDWTVDMEDGRKRLGREISVQGNVDPACLFSPLPALTEEIQRFAGELSCQIYVICNSLWTALDFDPALTFSMFSSQAFSCCRLLHSVI